MSLDSHHKDVDRVLERWGAGWRESADPMIPKLDRVVGSKPPAPAAAMPAARSDHRPPSRRPWLAAGTVAAVIVVALGSVYTVQHLKRGGGNPAVDGVATCGHVPHPAGQGTKVAMSLVVPSTVPASTRIVPQLRFTSLTGKSQSIEVDQADVVIVRSGRIVGKYKGPTAGEDLGLTVPATGAQTASARFVSVTARGCPHGRIDPANPDASRAPLPAGSYQLVVVLRGGSATYVSAPETFQIP